MSEPVRRPRRLEGRWRVRGVQGLAQCVFPGRVEEGLGDRYWKDGFGIRGLGRSACFDLLPRLHLKYAGGVRMVRVRFTWEVVNPNGEARTAAARSADKTARDGAEERER